MISVATSDPDRRATATIRTLTIDTVGWERLVGANGAIVGMDTFGACAPLKQLQTKFGFTPEAVIGIAKARLAAAAAG